MVVPPKLPKGHPGRAYECEAALEREAFRLFDRHGVPTKHEIEEFLSLTKSTQASVGDGGRNRVSVRNDT